MLATRERIYSGIGCSLDRARQGLRQNLKHYNLGVDRERGSLPLGQGVGLDELVRGDVI